MPFMVSTFTTMKTVGFILETIEMTLRKERRGMLKKSQIQTAIRVAINNFFDKQIKIMEASKPKLIPVPLQPFIVSSLLPVSATGVATLPADCAKDITFFIPNVNSNPAEMLDRSEMEERKNSVIMPPTELDPIGTIEGLSILVRPVNSSEIMFTYIKRPTEIAIATTLSGDSRSLIYDDNGSTDTEFKAEYAPDLIKEALQFLSVPQQDQGAAGLSATTKI